MANPEHLRILKQGVDVWNRWREEVPNMHPDLTHADLKNMNLCGVNFNFTHLLGSTLSGANLTGSFINAVSFRSANLTDANLSNSFISETDFTEAELRGADFSNATLGFTTFCDNDLSEVKGLESVTSRAPSYLDIDTIYRSKGNLPEAFLRKAGVPNSFITFVKSLVGKAMESYSCFISFTEADDAFSERLYNDLQAAGVRCWRWKEDAKWGRTLMRSIDEAVRVYDKLVVICSEASLKSPAVIREIERALQKEDDLARHGEDGEVLFPIRLDNYILNDWNHHRKADVVAKNVGDFRQWKEPESYRKNLARLVRDLKAEQPIINQEPVVTQNARQRQEQSLPIPRIEMLKFAEKRGEINDRNVQTLTVPFRNNSGVVIRNIVAQIRFENTETSQSRDVDYGFWIESDDKRISLYDGDTGHVALLSIERYQAATLNSKWTRRYVGAYCDMKPLQNGIWCVEITLIGDSFRQSYPPFRIEVSKRGAYRLSEQKGE